MPAARTAGISALGLGIGLALAACNPSTSSTAASGADASAPEAAVDDVLGLQAASASPMPRPSAEMPAVLAAGMKCPKFIVAVVLIVVMDRA